MKTQGKRISCLLLVIFAVLSLLLTACSEHPTIDPVGVATLVVSANGVAEEYEIPLSKLTGGSGAIAALDYLTSEGKLSYESTEGSFGAYLTRVGELRGDGSGGIYIGIWTSVEEDFDTSAYATTVTYKDRTLISSGKGISQMSLTDGSVIYIGELLYN